MFVLCCDVRTCGLIFILFYHFHTGGVLFKVYVIGDAIKVVRRFSLPDLSEKDMGYGVKSFPRVSSAAATADEADLDPEAAGVVFTPTLCRYACWCTFVPLVKLA